MENGALFFRAGNASSLASRLLEKEISSENLRIEFPDRPLKPDLTMLDAIRGDVACKGRDIVAHLDYSGVTSYIASENSLRALSTTEIQLWAISEIQKGNAQREFPLWGISLVMLAALIPFSLFKALSLQSISLVSLGIGLLGFSFLKFGGVSLSPLWLSVLLVPLGALAFIWISDKIQPPAASSDINALNAQSAEKETETEALRYRLKYYESLSNQTPIEGGDIDELDIHFAKESPMGSILAKAREVAKTEMPILILGESGTGKEKLAQFIHHCSARKEKPFIAVNCGSLNENLIESELFGYEQGAFTGANKTKQGRFEQANGGTLFLDEIGETSLAFQVKLLRVLQEGVFERVGGAKPIQVSVRVIGATHQRLSKLIEENLFRQDLFYRLNGFSISLPPLRERPMDIEYLFRIFLGKQNRSLKISDALLDWLKSQSWKGNIRELKAATERAVLNAAIRKRNFLLPDDFEIAETVEIKVNDAPDKVLETLRKYEFKHRAISAAAEDLSMHRVTVTEHLRGWVIRFLNQYEEREKVYAALKGDSVVQNETQFQERVDSYIESIYEKLREGLRAGEPIALIKSKRFKGVPSIFEQDLAMLAEKMKKGEIK
jgi:transcriptional regulator with GAF, ATPase, and Fis domain